MHSRKAVVMFAPSGRRDVKFPCKTLEVKVSRMFADATTATRMLFQEQCVQSEIAVRCFAEDFQRRSDVPTQLGRGGAVNVRDLTSETDHHAESTRSDVDAMVLRQSVVESPDDVRCCGVLEREYTSLRLDIRGRP